MFAKGHGEEQDWRVTYERGLAKGQQEFSVGQFALNLCDLETGEHPLEQFQLRI